MCVGFEGFW